MIELRPVETVERIKPSVRVLMVDQWVKFSKNFPSTMDHVKGKTFRIVAQQQVTYERSYILKEECYKDVNLGNDSGNELLYPDQSDHLYEMLVGFKPGNYFASIFFPSGDPIYRLDKSEMFPNIASSTYKYIAAIRPEDSPPENPILKMYLPYKLDPFILRLYVDDGVTYEKIVLRYMINRCLIQQGTPPASVSPKPILYIEELKTLRPVV